MTGSRVAILDFHLDPVWTFHVYVAVVATGSSERVASLTSTHDSCTYIGLVEFQNISGNLMHVASLGNASITASNSRNKTNQGMFTERHEQIEDFSNHHSNICMVRLSATLKTRALFIALTHLTLTLTDVFTNSYLFLSTSLLDTRSSPNTSGYRVSLQGNPRIPDSISTVITSICTRQQRRYESNTTPHHLTGLRAEFWRFLPIAPSVQPVRSVRAGRLRKRRGTARLESNCCTFDQSNPTHVQNYLFKKLRISYKQTNKQNKTTCSETVLIVFNQPPACFGPAEPL
jgi:hypothetical protein